MRQHPTDRDVQWYGHDALGALLSTTKRREVMKRFRESGGVEVVRQALDNHDFPRQKNVTDLLDLVKQYIKQKLTRGLFA
mmetsp:Transcript_8618/g.14581  ORF Transcript_8618/g.14581 Transcript_8618/m.14581 type:complete len:80 (-) Transcript_8618:17-256(-)